MRNSTKVVAMVVIEGDPITVAAVTVAGAAVVDRVWPAPSLIKFKNKKSGAGQLRFFVCPDNQCGYSAIETSKGLLASTFGSTTFNRPFLNSAEILEFSIPLSNWNERLNLP